MSQPNSFHFTNKPKLKKVTAALFSMFSVGFSHFPFEVSGIKLPSLLINLFNRSVVIPLSVKLNFSMNFLIIPEILSASSLVSTVMKILLFG